MATTTVINPVQSCVVQQSYLATQNQPGNGALDLGVMEALLNPANRAGLVSDPMISGNGRPISGSSCRLIFKYIKPDCEATGTDIDICELDPAQAENPFGNAEFQFEAANSVSRSYTLEKTQFDCSCDPQDRQVGALLNSTLRNIFKKSETVLLDDMWDCLGDYCNGLPSNVAENIQTLNVFNEAANAAQPAGWYFIFEQLQEMKMTGKPIVVGGSAVKKYLWMQKTAGIGAQGLGVTSNVTADIDFYYSSEFDAWARAKVGANGDYAIAFAPGAFQMIDWQYNTGANVEVGDDILRNTIEFTNNGRSYLVDYTMYYDSKCRKWTILPVRTAGVFCMPDSDICDDIIGNGRFLIKLGCGAVDCGPLCGDSSAS